jgi:hypothetical protein
MSSLRFLKILEQIEECPVDYANNLVRKIEICTPFYDPQEMIEALEVYIFNNGYVVNYFLALCDILDLNPSGTAYTAWRISFASPLQKARAAAAALLGDVNCDVGMNPMPEFP